MLFQLYVDDVIMAGNASILESNPEKMADHHANVLKQKHESMNCSRDAFIVNFECSATGPSQLASSGSTRKDMCDGVRAFSSNMSGNARKHVDGYVKLSSKPAPFLHNYNVPCLDDHAVKGRTERRQAIWHRMLVESCTVRYTYPCIIDLIRCGQSTI